VVIWKSKQLQTHNEEAMRFWKTRPRAQQVTPEQVTRIEEALARLENSVERMQTRAMWTLPTERSKPVGEPTYKVPASQTFAAEIREAREARNDGDEMLQRSLAARHHAPPSQADVWTVLIQFFPQIKAYVDAKVQDFQGAALQAFITERTYEKDDD
jgi:hypothetical protein